jgi:hypothetical protein
VRLLKLQWALQRLASLSGAVETIDALLDSDDEENDNMVRLYDSEEDFCKVDDVFGDNVRVYEPTLSFEAKLDKKPSTKTTDRLGSCDSEITMAVQGV